MSSNSRRIVNREQIQFANNEELKRYYEEKYRDGGYEGAGHEVRGIDVSALYHARRLESAVRLLDPQPDEVVLDAGCGNGALAARLALRCRAVHAVDIAANALDPKVAALPNVHFAPMNLETLSFPDEHFDGIACVETLEHLLSPDLALRELRRVLKRPGRFVLTYPTINRTAVKHLGLGRKVPISEHLNEWSYREAVAKVREHGFDVDRVEGIAFDFGPLLVLKHLSRGLSAGITHASLALRSFPANSMFVAMRLRPR